MNSFHDSLIYFWECITGIIDDKKAKILSLAAFVTLIAGITWSSLNLYKAVYGTNQNYLESKSAARQGNREFYQIEEAAEKIKADRRKGLEIAAKLNAMNRRLFNIDGFNNDIKLQDIPELKNMVNSLEANSESIKPVHKVQVRAIMLSDKNQIAVVDTENKKGVIVRQGQELPDGIGRVVKIKLNGLTVRNQNTRQEIEYLIK